LESIDIYNFVVKRENFKLSADEPPNIFALASKQTREDLRSYMVLLGERSDEISFELDESSSMFINLHWTAVIEILRLV